MSITVAYQKIFIINCKTVSSIELPIRCCLPMEGKCPDLLDVVNKAVEDLYRTRHTLLCGFSINWETDKTQVPNIISFPFPTLKICRERNDLDGWSELPFYFFSSKNHPVTEQRKRRTGKRKHPQCSVLTGQPLQPQWTQLVEATQNFGRRFPQSQPQVTLIDKFSGGDE